MTQRLHEVRSPLTAQAIGTVPLDDIASIDAKVARARQAQSTWAALSFRQRAKVLRAIGRCYLTMADQLAETIHREQGKSLSEAYFSEVIGAYELFRYWPAHAPRFLKDERLGLNPLQWPGKKAFIRYLPRGVVAVISPWNFSLAIPLRAIIPALMAGNAVLFKPATATMMIGQRLEEVFNTHLPEGLMSVIYASGEAASHLLDTGIDFLAFTGSVPIGRKLAAMAAERLIPHSLELGGKDPAIVLEDADLDRSAHGIVWGAFNNAGQNCASVERVYVVQSVAKPFIDRVVQRTRELTSYASGGSGEYDVGPLTTEKQRRQAEQHIEQFKRSGAKVVVGGKAHKIGYGLDPTVIVDATNAMRPMQEETFGPTLPIVVVQDEAEAIALANDSNFGLTASVWTADIDHGKAIAEKLNAGSITINNCGFTGTLPNAPWSGWKETGYGATNSHLALREMVRPKVVLLDRNSRREPWWYPYHDISLTMARSMIAVLRDPPLKKISALLTLSNSFLKRFSPLSAQKKAVVASEGLSRP